MQIHKPLGLGTVGINRSSFHPVCSSPPQAESFKPLSDHSFLTQSILAFYLLGPAVFQTQPWFYPLHPCVRGGEMAGETCPLDVQTLTNPQLLEITPLTKASVCSLSHRKADCEDKSPRVYTN